MQWKLSVDIDKFWAELKTCEYREIVNKLCMMRFESLGKSSWGDKTPQYLLDLDIIYNLFPDSKYLYLIRDGRDVAISLLRMPWGERNIYSCAEYWKQCYIDSPTLHLMQKRGQLIEIKYENLIEQPKAITKTIYQFLNEEYDEDKLLATIDSIDRKNCYKWKTEMNPKNIKLFEIMASNTLKRFGYEASFSEHEVGKIEKVIWKTHNSLFHFMELIKMNTIEAIQIKYFGKEPFVD